MRSNKSIIVLLLVHPLLIVTTSLFLETSSAFTPLIGNQRHFGIVPTKKDGIGGEGGPSIQKNHPSISSQLQEKIPNTIISAFAQYGTGSAEFQMSHDGFKIMDGLLTTTASDATTAAAAAAIVNQDNSNLSTAHSSWSYSNFATNFPVLNNMMLASIKAAAADLLAQTVIAQSGLDTVDWHRTLLFCLFGAFYQGGFQYMYQVNIFSKLFDVETFTSQPWMEKLRNGPGLRSLGAQVLLDLMIMSSIYLPTYYTFKASIFSGTVDPTAWVHNGISSYESHFPKDEIDLLRVWIPADVFCFSVPLILRLPIRHVISLFYTAYLSYASFGN